MSESVMMLTARDIAIRKMKKGLEKLEDFEILLKNLHNNSIDSYKEDLNSCQAAILSTLSAISTLEKIVEL